MFRVLILIIFSLSLGLAASPFTSAHAQSVISVADLFTVRDIPLDSQARTAQSARADALSQGQVAAAQEMLQRLTLSRDWIALPVIGADDVASLVTAIQIDEERISARRYQARLTVEFDASSIRNLLRRSSIAFSEARYKPLLIVPVYVTGGLVSFSNASNPFVEAWANASHDPGLIPYKVQGVDGLRTVSVAGDSALSLPASTIERMRAQTGAVSVVAVRIDVLSKASDRPRIRIRARDYSNTDAAVLNKVLFGARDETLDQLVTRAATQVQVDLEDHWKGQTLVRFDQRGMLSVDVPLSSLPQWRDILARLRNNLLIDHVDIVRLASDRASIMLHYLGRVEPLRVSLAQSDLMLAPLTNTQQQGTNTQQPGEDAIWQLVNWEAGRETGRESSVN